MMVSTSHCIYYCPLNPNRIFAFESVVFYSYISHVFNEFLAKPDAYLSLDNPEESSIQKTSLFLMADWIFASWLQPTDAFNKHHSFQIKVPILLLQSALEVYKVLQAQTHTVHWAEVILMNANRGQFTLCKAQIHDSCESNPFSTTPLQTNNQMGFQTGETESVESVDLPPCREMCPLCESPISMSVPPIPPNVAQRCSSGHKLYRCSRTLLVIKSVNIIETFLIGLV